MNNSAMATNQDALSALCNGDIHKAQSLFRINAKESPCLYTYNNLGVFYLQEGMVLRNGKTRRAGKTGMDLLKRAEAFGNHGLNHAAIAREYLKTGSVENALFYYERACLSLRLYPVLNNYGVALYLANMFAKSSELFGEAVNCCNDADEKQGIIVSYAYSTLKIDKRKCHDIITRTVDSTALSSNMLDVDKFIILYFCDDFVTASKMQKQLFDRYHVDCCTFAMIQDCLHRLAKADEAYECLIRHIELLNGYDYDIRKEVASAKRAYASCDYRRKLISEYACCPSIIEQCYYCYCKQHDVISEA